MNYMAKNPALTLAATLQLQRTMHDALSLVESGLELTAAQSHRTIDLIVELRSCINTAFMVLGEQHATVHALSGQASDPAERP
jgi:hypothetical protein